MGRSMGTLDRRKCCVAAFVYTWRRSRKRELRQKLVALHIQLKINSLFITRIQLYF